MVGSPAARSRTRARPDDGMTPARPGSCGPRWRSAPSPLRPLARWSAYAGHALLRDPAPARDAVRGAAREDATYRALPASRRSRTATGSSAWSRLCPTSASSRRCWYGRGAADRPEPTAAARAGRAGRARVVHDPLARPLLVVDEALKELTAAQIAQFLADELESFIEPGSPQSFLFTDFDGGPIRHTNWYKRTFKPLAGATRFHDLRHTCAALLIDQGAHPAAIQQHLGHEDIRTTLNTYGSLFPAAQEAMAASLDAAYQAAAKSAPRVRRLRD